MDKHVHKDLELADELWNAADTVHVQHDEDYPVDPLDLPDYAPAPGKAATEKRQS